MADIKISQLGSASTITGAEMFPESFGGTSYKATASQIKDYVIGTTSLSGIGDGTPTGAIKSLSDDIDDKVLFLTSVACSATTGNFATVANAAITANHVVASIEYDNPAAITTDVTWTTATGSLVLNGTCASATSATIILIKKDN